MSDDYFKFHGPGRVMIDLNSVHIPSEDYDRLIVRSEWPTIKASIPITQEVADRFMDLFEDPDWPNVVS